MKLKIKYVFTSILLILITSCESNKIKISYYPNKQVKDKTVFYSNGYSHTSYFENGKLKAMHTLKDSLLHDTFKIYNEKGDLVMYCKFNSGIPLCNLLGIKKNGDTIFNTSKNDPIFYVIFGENRLKKKKQNSD